MCCEELKGFVLIWGINRGDMCKKFFWIVIKILGSFYVVLFYVVFFSGYDLYLVIRFFILGIVVMLFWFFVM